MIIYCSILIEKDLLVVVPLVTPTTQMIFFNKGTLILGSNHFLIDLTSSSGKFPLPVTFNLFISSWRACVSFFFTEVVMSSQRFFTFKIYKKKLMISYNWFWVLSLTMKSKRNCFSHRLLQINAGLSNDGLGDKNVVIIIVIRCLLTLPVQQFFGLLY